MKYYTKKEPKLFLLFKQFSLVGFFYPRTGEWLDWLADGVGVLIGSTIWLIAQKIHERRMAK